MSPEPFPEMAAVAAQAKRDRAARWKSDFDYVVAHFEKDDCAGFGRARTCGGGDFVANGNDGGSGAAYGRCESAAAAVFQSAAQDGDTGGLAGI
jgi:hypothetical protein